MKLELNAKHIDALDLPENGQRIVWDKNLSGFALRLTPTARSFIVEARVNGKTHRVTVGRYPTLTAQDARKMAKKKLGRMADGVDITAEARRDRVQSISLGEATAYYLANKRKKDGKELKDSTRRDIEKHTGKAFKDWAGKAISTITPDMVRARYKTLSKKSVAQANQAFRVLSAIINYSARVHKVDGVTVILGNPCEVLRDETLLREVKARTNAVPPEKLGAWWSALDEVRAEPGNYFATQSAADCAALLALTGLRSGEGRAVKWSDVDLGAGTLRLTDTKNRSDLLLPLSTVAVNLTGSRPRVTEYVFPNRRRDSYIRDVRGPLSTVADKCGIDVAPHDLRRTFIRTGVKTLKLSLYRIKRLSNHRINTGEATEAHYLDDHTDVTDYRSDVEAIAQHYVTEAAKHTAANVVELRRGERA